MKGRKLAVAAGIMLIAGGVIALDEGAATPQHPAPQPGAAQSGSTGWVVPAPPARSAAAAPSSAPPGDAVSARERRSGLPGVRGPALAKSPPVSISIPAIGVHSRLLHLGLNPDGSIQVPPLNDPRLTNEAAWYKYSPAPGQPGPSVILGHVDSAAYGPSVFFRLGALAPGNKVDVSLADHQVAVFKITGVRIYRKDRFPSRTVYGPTDQAALRLITCGGSFDQQTGHYLSNVVAFASLESSYQD